MLLFLVMERGQISFIRMRGYHRLSEAWRSLFDPAQTMAYMLCVYNRSARAAEPAPRSMGRFLKIVAYEFPRAEHC